MFKLMQTHMLSRILSEDKLKQDWLRINGILFTLI